MWSYRRWRRTRYLKHARIDAQTLAAALFRLPFLRPLTTDERSRLTDLSLLFLHEKVIEPVQGLKLDEVDHLVIALQACLPIVNLDLDWYDGWKSVIVYPEEFVSEHDDEDEIGVVHHVEEIRSGESWLHGPVILAWDGISDPAAFPDHNLVIHEFAHKLDMLNGDANGFPPLHGNMRISDWAAAFTRAYADFEKRVDQDEAMPIDPYAAESPAEFFAVLSEVFFVAPQHLVALYPEVYQQLVAFYRQDPVTRRAG